MATQTFITQRNCGPHATPLNFEINEDPASVLSTLAINAAPGDSARPQYTSLS